jgi:hypothetical protein
VAPSFPAPPGDHRDQAAECGGVVQDQAPFSCALPNTAANAIAASVLPPACNAGTDCSAAPFAVMTLEIGALPASIKYRTAAFVLRDGDGGDGGEGLATGDATSSMVAISLGGTANDV